MDPEGLELRWTTLEKMLGRWCDIIINFQSVSILRIFGSAANNPSYERSLDNFFGTGNWRACTGEDDLLALYVQRVGKFRDVVIPIKVQGPGVFHYHMIVGVRKTRGTQGWIEAIHRAKQKIEQATSKDAEGYLDIYHARQLTLSTDFE